MRVAKLKEKPWGLWTRQVLAVLRLEARKSFLGKRAIPIYLVAFLPVLLLGGRAVALLKWGGPADLAGAATTFAVMFQGFILRFIVFFGCAWIFTNLFRGEILERSLHYYFLSPIQREVLVVAKFVSGLFAAAFFFVGAVAVSLVLLCVPDGASAALEQLLEGAGLGRSVAYLGITALACLAYGAVFLATSLFFRNPFIPAVAILGWESINFLLPPALKKVSVYYYLVSLCPVQVSQGPFALLSEPTPAWISVPGLLALTAVVLLVAGYRIRRTEIIYGAE